MQYSGNRCFISIYGIAEENSVEAEEIEEEHVNYDGFGETCDQVYKEFLDAEKNFWIGERAEKKRFRFPKSQA